MPRVPVLVPELGAGPVSLGLWLVEPGEAVYGGDRVAEVIVAGAAVTVAAPATGRFSERLVWPGDSLSAGQTIGFVEAAREEEP